jgi:carbon storage regulator
VGIEGLLYKTWEGEVRMLVLSRKIGEKIHVGGDVTIEVRRVAGNRVTLAVEAPREVRILRGELKDAAEAFDEPPRARTAATSAETFVVSHDHLHLTPAAPSMMG